MEIDKLKIRQGISSHSKKYADQFFVEKYVALWAYGYKNKIGQSETLYRTIDELSFSCLSKDGEYSILDVGCGVGRTASDYAKFFTKAEVTGIDDAQLMIDMARRVNGSDDDIVLDMSSLGFGKMVIKGEKIENLTFQNISLFDFFSKSTKNSFDLISALNFIDRVENVEESLEQISSLLKPGGVFICASPLDFSNKQDWERYESPELLTKLVQKIGFIVEVSFDGLMYKEVLDARGATEEYPTFVMRLVKTK